MDGCDVIAVFAAVKAALAQAKNNETPSVIEAITYRLSDHTTADDARRYRPDEEVEAAWKQEPIKRMRAYLRDQGVWNDKKEMALLDDVARQIEEAVAEYQAVGIPPLEHMFDYMFENMPLDLEAQRDSVIKENQ